MRITPDRVASAFRIHAEAATTAPTGVEMEALTAASVAALTLYDMVKGVEKGVEIRSIRLVAKSGGKSGEWHRPAEPAETVGSPRRPGRGPSAVRARSGGIRRGPAKARRADARGRLPAPRTS